MIWVLLLAVASLGATNRSSENDVMARRRVAMQLVYRAYGAAAMGDRQESIALVDSALAVAPGLAMAHIVRAGFAMQGGNWQEARKEYEKGIALVRQGYQPLSPLDEVEIRPADVEADARCFLGYVYLKLASTSRRRGHAGEERMWCMKARKTLERALALTPGPETREMAEQLLQSIRKSSAE